jgi:hypothetical protein
MRSNRALRDGMALAAFSAAIFLPLIGRGFVHDDFMWLSSVAHQSRWYGLTHPTPSFYTPLTWLSFKLDWNLWGLRPFPFALENLLLHIANTLLLYRLALRLWQTRAAAWWSAFGFALLYIANSWAVMWISARTHLLATLFCLGAMLAAVCYVQSERRKLLAALAVVSCCALSMLAKEIGVASVAASLIVMWYAGGGLGHWRERWAQAALLSGALLAVLCFYLMLRAWAGALSVASNEGWYQYAFESKVLFLNLREYLSRTYLIAALLAGAIALSEAIRGVRPKWNALTRREVFLSVMLFAVTIAPVILIRGRSGLYTYLPGIGAALLLGATARALYPTMPDAPAQTWVNLLPIFLLAAALSLATVGQSWKWRTMAQTNSVILRQIAQQDPQPPRNSHIILRYAQRDRRHRFPDGFGTWGFPFAVKLLYDEPALRGDIAGEAVRVEQVPGSMQINYLYVAGEDSPKVIRP